MFGVSHPFDNPGHTPRELRFDLTDFVTNLEERSFILLTVSELFMTSAPANRFSRAALRTEICLPLTWVPSWHGERSG